MQSVDKAIEILRWCLTHSKTLGEGSKNFGYSRDYVSRVCKKYTHIDDPKCRELATLYNKLHKRSHRSSPSDSVGPIAIEKEETVFDVDSGVIDARGFSHVKTLDDILTEAKVDLNIWEVERHLINKWDVTNAYGDVYQNWQVKVWLKQRLEAVMAFDFESVYKDLLNKYKPIPYKPIKYNTKREKNLLFVNIADLHCGKLAWNEETGEDYDIKIASYRFKYALDVLLQRTSGCEFDRILFVVGNDFFNSDTPANTTTAGTPQDEDTRWQKTFQLGFKLLIEAIDKLRQFAFVDVVVIPGNHDSTRAWFCGHSLAAWYREDNNVAVDNRVLFRKYYRYGKVLLGLTHGNEEKESILAQLMAHEAKADWAETDFHEWILGHVHRKRAWNYKVPIYNEDLGVTVRYMSSLSGTDAYHFKKGFVGSNKSAEAHLWNFDSGHIAQFNVNVK